MLTEEQKEKRIEGLGASDSPIVMGYSSYKTPYQLYLEKTGVVTAQQEETEQQYWGKVLEPLIINRFAEENNVKISLLDTVYHPDHPFIFANLDGYIESENAVVEAKCANAFQRREWDSTFADGIPLVYLIQIAKQVSVVNADRGYCAVLIGGCEYHQFVYERDKALEELIIQSDIDFWHCVQNKIEPSSINTNDCRLKYGKVSPEKIVHATFTINQSLNELINVKSGVKKLLEAEDKHKMQLMNHMQDAEYLMGQDGEIMATWKANKKGTRVFNIK